MVKTVNSRISRSDLDGIFEEVKKCQSILQTYVFADAGDEKTHALVSKYQKLFYPAWGLISLQLGVSPFGDYQTWVLVSYLQEREDPEHPKYLDAVKAVVKALVNKSSGELKAKKGKFDKKLKKTWSILESPILYRRLRFRMPLERERLCRTRGPWWEAARQMYFSSGWYFLNASQPFTRLQKN